MLYNASTAAKNPRRPPAERLISWCVAALLDGEALALELALAAALAREPARCCQYGVRISRILGCNSLVAVAVEAAVAPLVVGVVDTGGTPVEMHSAMQSRYDLLSAMLPSPCLQPLWQLVTGFCALRMVRQLARQSLSPTAPVCGVSAGYMRLRTHMPPTTYKSRGSWPLILLSTEH